MEDFEEILAKPASTKKGTPKKVKPEDCPEHFKKYEIFCKDCDQLLCVKCVTAHDTGHNLTDLDSLIENFVAESEIGRNSFNQRITELDDLALEAKRTKEGILGTFEDFELKITEEQEYIQGIQTQFITYEQDLGLMKEAQQIIQAFHKKDEIKAIREEAEANMMAKTDGLKDQAETLIASLEYGKAFVDDKFLPKKRKQMEATPVKGSRKGAKGKEKSKLSVPTDVSKPPEIQIPSDEEEDAIELVVPEKKKGKGKGKGKKGGKPAGTASSRKRAKKAEE